MSRIDIVYGGKPYTLGDRTLESLRAEITAAVTSGVPSWLRVNSGAGRYQDAYLLISAGTAIAIVDVQPNAPDVILTDEQTFIADSTE
ncbi:hypothetical protein [Cryobacterium sp. PAMC25264]|uniref:hypothetical protein n=1 Tax=Cryobacterium sp. PAMC25264 TaxID=2861288 RepID=UPI001C627283|nr:hypothetical protein [Cryobacterium sp. PAMC25264]QYF73539.1 hypothetical protein KY500_17855 [Cryobacterium sp. PAMC25264]